MTAETIGKLTRNIARIAQKGAALVASICVMSVLHGCFTGIEGTKTIELSKNDLRTLAPTEEEAFLADIKPTELAKWAVGKPFFIADDKARVLFDRWPLDVNAGGLTIEYRGTDVKQMPDGTQRCVLLFSPRGHDEILLRYATDKTPDDAKKELLSTGLPLLTDVAMAGQIANRLEGRKVWTRSRLWFDKANSEKIKGYKFVPVTIEAVECAADRFPLKVVFRDDSGREAYQFMNFGNSGSDSRTFASLYFLSNYRDRFPKISDQNWALIQEGLITNGMTKEECRLSLGNPTEAMSGHDYSQTLDLWHYDEGRWLRFEDGVLVEYR